MIRPLRSLRVLHRARPLFLLPALLALFATGAGAQQLSDGLVAYWKLDDSLLDSVGTYGGTMAGNDTTATYAPGKFGTAIDLEGDAAQRIVIGGDENDLDFAGGSVSVSAWFTVESFTKSWQALVAKGEGNGWRIARRDVANIMSYAGGTGDIPADNTTGPDVNDGQFHHIVAISEGGVSTRLWVDGQLVVTGGAPTLENRANPMMIGGNPDTGGDTFRTWDGKIDDVAIWNRPLTDEEIESIWNNGDGMPVSAFLASGQEFFIDFNDPEQNAALMTFGNSAVRTTDGAGGAGDGYLSVTDNLNGQRGGVIFPDLTGGLPVSAFEWSLDLRVGGGTTSPADGFSFNLVRPNDPLLNPPDGNGYAGSPNGAEQNLPEEGSTTGLGIGFDEWDSGAPDVVGISIRVDGALVNQVALPTRNGLLDDPTSLQTGPLGPLGQGDDSELGWATFTATLDENKLLTITWKGEPVFSDTVNWNPSPARIVMGGRTGDANGNHHVDNIRLTITSSDQAVLSNVRASRTFVEFEVTDVGASVLDQGTVMVLIGGVDVTAGLEFSKSNNITTIRHNQDPPFDHGQTIDYEFTAADNFGQPITGDGDFTLPTPLFPPNADLAGAEDNVDNGMWGVRYIFNSDVPGTTTNALTMIQAANDPGFPGSVVDVSEPFMNHSDTGAAWVIVPDEPYHPDAVAEGCCTDNFIMYGICYMQVTDPGGYTFGVHSDDGFGVRIQGVEFTEVFGAGKIDPGSSDTFLFQDPTGDSNTRAYAPNIEAGIYRVEFFWWENGGGDHGELFVAKGRFPNDGDTSTWLALGDLREGGSYVVPGFSDAGVTVTSLGPNLVEDPNSLGGADFDRFLNPFGGDDAGLTNNSEVEDALANNALTPLVTVHDAINFNDPQSGGPGRIGGDVPFPNDTPADDNDFLIAFEATLVIPQSGLYDIGFQGDDGSYLMIEGQTFQEPLIENLTTFGVIDQGGSRINTDFPTGNSSTVGRINLAAGNYAVSGVFFERGGGAYFEVFGVEAGGSPQLITRNGAGVVDLPDRGIGIVSPGGRVLQFTDVQYDQGADEFTLTFTSRAGKFYTLFTSINGLDFGQEIDDSIEGEDGSTTIVVANPSPGASNVFFLVSENE